MKIPNNPRIAIAGSVNSSKKVLEKLIEHQMNVVRVYGLSPQVAEKVSGYQDLKSIAEKANLPFQYFEKINDDKVIEDVNEADIDVFFVVGLSQIIRQDLIDSAKHACIGYHPTKLPKGRGRAALAWIVIGEVEPAATFFKIDNGVDSGDIFISKSIVLKGDEYAQDVVDKLLIAIEFALDELLPQLKAGLLSSTPQNNEHASYLEIRRPNDGYIDWKESAVNIHKLIRALSRPLPGAFTYFSDQKIFIWKANFHENFNVKGVVGRVLRCHENSFFVQTGLGVLEVTEYSVLDQNLYKPKVGDKLGLDPIELLRQINVLNKRLKHE
jgi:methionyl-tRNA formyltransferase